MTFPPNRKNPPVAAGDTVMVVDSLLDMPVTCKVVAVDDGWAWIKGPGVNRIAVDSKLEKIA